jgi:5-methylcytosine-specific restriction endonuclease McrA
MNEKATKDRSEYLRQWHLANRERRLLERKARYRINYETERARLAAYHATHPEIAKKSQRNYRQRNLDSCRAKIRDYYHNNLERERARSRAKSKRQYSENREKILSRNREWAARNKDKIRQRDLRRKALKNGAKVNLAHMQEWMDSVKSRRTATCYWCDKTILSKDLHFDHIVPLAKGGEHSVENLCVSCEACNCAKQAKLVTAWVRIGQQTLTL